MDLKETSGRLSGWQRGALAAVLLLGVGLRLHGLGEKSLWYDEAWSIAYADCVHSVGDAFTVERTMDPPLFLTLLKGYKALVYAVVDLEPYSAERDAWLRGLPFFFGVLAMALVFFVGRLILRSNTAAIVAALVYAISPYQIRYAQELRNYTVWTVLGLGALYFLVRSMRENRLRHWAGLAVVEALMLYAHYFSAWFILSINLYVLAVFVAGKSVRDARIKPWAASQALAAAAALPPMLTVLHLLGMMSNIKYHWYPLHGPKIALIAFKAFFAGFSPNAALYWAVFLLASALFGLGLWALRRRWETAALLGLVVAVPLAGNVVLTYLNQYSLYELRLFMLSGVAAYMVVGAGVVALKRPLLMAAAAVSLGALMLPMAGDYYAERLHPVEAHRIGIWEKVDFRSAARYVREHARAGDAIGHPGHFSQQSFMHYAPGVPQYVLGHSQVDQQVMIDTFGIRSQLEFHKVLPEPLQAVAEQARRIWFVEAGGVNFNWPPLVALLREWLETNAVREDFEAFDGVTVTCYRTAGARDSGRLRERLEDAGNGWTVASGGVENLEESGRFTYSVTVRNLGDTPKKLSCAVYDTDGAVEPLAWTRPDPLTNPWRPESLYDPETGGLFNRPGMTAALSRETPEAEMQGWAVLEAGRYVPFLHVYEEPEGGSRATATLTLEAPGVVLGSLDGVAGSGERGWHWRRLNEFEYAGGLALFSMRAENRGNLENAWFQMERVFFVGPDAAAVDGAPVSRQFEIELGPGESRELEMEGQLAGRARARVEVELFDPETRTYGTVSFYATGNSGKQEAR